MNQHSPLRIGHSTCPHDCPPTCALAARRDHRGRVYPNSAHERGAGINVLTCSDAPAPYGGAPVHDNKVWVRAAEPA